MAYSAATFTAAQTIGLPSIVTLTDTHTGTDVLVTQRRVYLQKKDGTYLVPAGTTTSYIAWALADASISIDALNKDYSLLITVQWLDASNVVLYTTSTLFYFTLYNSQVSLNLTKALSSSPDTLMDKDYWTNRVILRCNIDDSAEAVSLGGDQYTAQAALDRATYMTNRQQTFFGV
jgi:hypothetical protein